MTLPPVTRQRNQIEVEGFRRLRRTGFYSFKFQKEVMRAFTSEVVPTA